MQISKLTFVGTVDEFAAVAHLFEEASHTGGRPHRQGRDARQPPASVPELIRKVLTRMPVPPAQQALYRALFRAGEAGLGASELAAAIHRTEPELAGVLGALGRRINRTSGMYAENSPGVELMFEVKQEGGQWHYRMRDELREVLEEYRPSWL